MLASGLHSSKVSANRADRIAVKRTADEAGLDSLPPQPGMSNWQPVANDFPGDPFGSPAVDRPAGSRGNTPASAPSESQSSAPQTFIFARGRLTRTVANRADLWDELDAGGDRAAGAVSRHDIAGIWVAFFQECQQNISLRTGSWVGMAPATGRARQHTSRGARARRWRLCGASDGRTQPLPSSSQAAR